MKFKQSYNVDSAELSNSKLNQNEKDKPNIVDDELTTSCGFGSWRPKWLQSFASPVWFLASLSLIGIVQGMSGPLFFGSMSTLEKRYAFDSKVSGVILIADNFSQMILSPLIGYFGIRFNRSRMVSFGEILLALSCLITAMPYFFYGPAEHLLHDTSLLSSMNKTTNIELCLDNSQSHECSDNRGATVWPAVVLLFIGSFFRGIGLCIYYVIGFPFLDDNVSKKNSPMYISMMFSVRLIGPSTGYMLSSMALRYYENPFVDPGIPRTDPRFVGAWWISFLMVSFLLFLAALPMLLFPPQLKTASVKADYIQKKIKESGGSIDALKRYFTNPILVITLIGNSFRYIGLGGYIMFKTKYIESHFRQSSSTANLITGTVSIMPMAIGILLGGIAITLLKPKPKFVFIFVFVIEFISLTAFSAGYIFGCDPIDIQGTTLPNNKFSLESTCNRDCLCNTHVYNPLCGPDGQTTYFSPCHAGCTSFNSSTSLFENCSCFEGTPTSGYCSKDTKSCQYLFHYLVAILVGGIVSSSSMAASSLISLRSVEPTDKSFTMGISGSLLAIFSFIPYPLIYGAITDSVCLIWEEKCGKTGNCWVYDQEKFRTYLHGATIIFMGIGAFFQFILIFFSHRIKSFFDDDDLDISNDNGKQVDQDGHTPKTNTIELKSF